MTNGTIHSIIMHLNAVDACINSHSRAISGLVDDFNEVITNNQMCVHIDSITTLHARIIELELQVKQANQQIDALVDERA